MAIDEGFWVFDIEANGLLDENSINYDTSPWTIKEGYKAHCIVAINYHTGEVKEWVQEECYTDFRPWVNANVKKIVAHNGINFDLLLCKAVFGMDYSLPFEGTQGYWDGNVVEIVDTYVLSKTLWADRPGHSIDYLGKLVGVEKIDWRAKAVELGLIEWNSPKGAEFAVYHPEMLVYNKRDVEVNIKVYDYLMKEWGDWAWDDAFELEQYVAWVITRQSHRGFWFDSELAVKNVRELDELMKERQQIVEPHLPPKPLGKTKAKEYIPCATQFLKSGKPSTHITKWVGKHGGTIEEREDGYYAILLGQEHKLPMPQEPLITEEPSKISDSTFIKEFLVGLGWKPTAYKEKDLTLDTKKRKLSPEKFAETVERYVAQTLASNFCEDRLERVGATRHNLRDKLLKHDLKKPLKVLTNPTFTVGQEKQIDPALEEMEATFPYTKHIVEYLTYNHRRNSILGGGADPDDEDDEGGKGFLANVRSDGRIPTPADTCGCATSRFQHKLVANIPRVSSLFGEPMRSMFGVGDKKRYAQFAFDFCSLEAMIESHYCYRYDKTEGKEYCNSLVQEKPNDVHTKTAAKISDIIAEVFSRTNAKSVKYCCSYGGQGPKVAKTVGCSATLGHKIFDAFWEAAKPLADLKEALTKYWETKGGKKFILGIDGRKIMSRSKHSLVNALFQSAGVICAKRTMAYQDVAFRAEGISVDFWVDDWKNKQYVQQLIAYHR